MKSILVKHFSGREESIVTDCFIVMPSGMVDVNGDRRYCKIENAVWDTGATNTVVSQDVIDALGLRPTGESCISAYGGVVTASTYVVDLCFENGYRIQNLEVIGGDCAYYDVIIGMDVITQGDFCITTFEGKTSFFFQMPSKGVLLKQFLHQGHDQR